MLVLLINISYLKPNFDMNSGCINMLPFSMCTRSPSVLEYWQQYAYLYKQPEKVKGEVLIKLFDSIVCFFVIKGIASG